MAISGVLADVSRAPDDSSHGFGIVVHIAFSHVGGWIGADFEELMAPRAGISAPCATFTPPRRFPSPSPPCSSSRWGRRPPTLTTRVTAVAWGGCRPDCG